MLIRIERAAKGRYCIIYIHFIYHSYYLAYYMYTIALLLPQNIALFYCIKINLILMHYSEGELKWQGKLALSIHSSRHLQEQQRIQKR